MLLTSRASEITSELSKCGAISSKVVSVFTRGGGHADVSVTFVCRHVNRSPRDRRTMRNSVWTLRVQPLLL